MTATIRISGGSVRKLRLAIVGLFEVLSLTVCITGAALEQELGLSYPLRLFTSISAAVQGAVFCFLIVVHFLTADGRWLLFYGGVSLLRIMVITSLCIVWISTSTPEQSLIVGFTVGYLLTSAALALVYIFVVHSKSEDTSTPSSPNVSLSRSTLSTLESSLVRAFPPPPKYEEITRDSVPAYTPPALQSDAEFINVRL